MFTFFEPIENDSKKRGEDISTKMAKAMAEAMGKLFRGNMAVVVKKTSDNFYKVHRILAPNYRKLDIQNIKNSKPMLRRGYTKNDGAQANSIGFEFKYYQLFYSCRKIHFVISRTVSSMGRGW